MTPLQQKLVEITVKANDLEASMDEDRAVLIACQENGVRVPEWYYDLMSNDENRSVVEKECNKIWGIK